MCFVEIGIEYIYYGAWLPVSCRPETPPLPRPDSGGNSEVLGSEEGPASHVANTPVGPSNIGNPDHPPTWHLAPSLFCVFGFSHLKV